jgi:hypothetical protein
MLRLSLEGDIHVLHTNLHKLLSIALAPLSSTAINLHDNQSSEILRSQYLDSEQLLYNYTLSTLNQTIAFRLINSFTTCSLIKQQIAITCCTD